MWIPTTLTLGLKHGHVIDLGAWDFLKDIHVIYTLSYSCTRYGCLTEQGLYSILCSLTVCIMHTGRVLKLEEGVSDPGKDG